MTEKSATPSGDGAGTDTVGPAWYAASPGGWRDWIGVLHLPYTAWNLSYVLVGAGLASQLSVTRLVATLIAFGLAVGVAAHCLDELRGRPLGTSIPAPHLAAASAASLLGATAIGAIGITRVGWGLLGFVAVGVAIVVAYNLELWSGRLHNDATFSLAWGAFPVLTAYYAQVSTLRPAVAVAALYAYGLSRAQRLLSVEARDVRRRVRSIEGEKRYLDGRVVPLSRQSMLRPVEQGLVALSWSTCALGVALVLAKTGH